MAYFTAKKLGIRPSEILDEWCTPELIVTFGEYANEDSARAYDEWKQLDRQQRSKVSAPKEYIVKFHNINEE